MAKAAYLYGQLYAARCGIGIVHPKFRAESSKSWQKAQVIHSTIFGVQPLRRPTYLGLRIAAGLCILQAPLNRPQTLVAVNISNGTYLAHIINALTYGIVRRILRSFELMIDITNGGGKLGTIFSIYFSPT